MSEVRQQVLIEAPPNVVWALITDVNRHPEWWPDVEEVYCEDFPEGCSYREVIKVPLGTAEREFVVNEATDCQRFRIDCVVSGAFVDLGLTEAQGSIHRCRRRNEPDRHSLQGVRRDRRRLLLPQVAGPVAGGHEARRDELRPGS